MVTNTFTQEKQEKKIGKERDKEENVGGEKRRGRKKKGRKRCCIYILVMHKYIMFICRYVLNSALLLSALSI